MDCESDASLGIEMLAVPREDLGAHSYGCVSTIDGGATLLVSARIVIDDMATMASFGIEQNKYDLPFYSIQDLAPVADEFADLVASLAR